MKILLVEDEVKLANAMKRALELQKYTVDVAHNGRDGLDLAVGELFDLVILDWMLPEIDGMTICKEMRENNIATPILLLTAKGQIDDKIRGLDEGADDYMVKPFSFEELFARIRALTRRPTHAKNPIVKLKDITLNPTTFIVKRGDRIVDLSVKEYALLEFLIRHKNIVYSREQILTQVWNYDSNVLPGTVEVHIKHLRDKLDKGYSTSAITTVRGRGYTIRE